MFMFPNGKLYGVSRATIFIAPDGIGTTSSSWQHIGGKLKQVDIDGNTVCGVN